MVLSVKLTMDNLYHAPNHLSDLIIKEGLSFQVELNEFDSLNILTRCDFEGFFVHIHIFIRCQINHKSLGSCLPRFHILCVVVIRFCTQEGVSEQSVNSLFLSIR